MAADFSIESTKFGSSYDQRWAKSNHGLDAGITGTLDLATLTPHANANGDLVSGIALGEITATGLYGLFDPAATDGREVLARFIIADVNIFGADRKVLPSGKVPFAGLAHGTIDTKFLPIVAQRESITYLTATRGQFVFVD